VPGDRLLDRVWGQRPPQRGRDTVYSYLSRLRRLLAAGAGIVHRPGGYALTVDPMAVDLHRFRHLVSEARSAGDGAHAASLFDEALDLWRGEPLAGLDTPWLDGIRQALQRLHRQILTADPVLTPASPIGYGSPTVPRQLPAPPGSFTGRAHQLATLSNALEARRTGRGQS
jgi:DNA-binding SARP family transcriptional activator